MTRPDHLRQIIHKLLQRLNPIERTAIFDVFPIYHKLELVTTSPIAYQSPRRGRRDTSHQKPAVEIECCSLPLELDVKVRRIMITEIHANNNTKKGRDNRHSFYRPWPISL